MKKVKVLTKNVKTLVEFVCDWRDILRSRQVPHKEAMPIANVNQSSIAPEQVKADPN